MLLTGMVSAFHLDEQLGDSPKANAMSAAANSFPSAVLKQFAPTKYSRYLGGSPRSVDLGVTFLLAPFADVTDTQVRDLWRLFTFEGVARGGASEPR